MDYLVFITILVLILCGIRLLYFYRVIKKSRYSLISGNNLWKTLFDKGNYGEFLIFRILEGMGEPYILTNVYLPKNNGDTTEVDLILVNRKGIFVFESKNYSGWIFGDEKSKNWTQSLRGGKKNKFYNPIMQNRSHIATLDIFLNKQYHNYFYSYIIFSERCELKKIGISSADVFVMKRSNLSKIIQKHISKLQNVFSIRESKCKYMLYSYSIIWLSANFLYQ